MTQTDVNKFKNNLLRTHAIGCSWLLKTPPNEEESLLPDIETILFSSDFLAAENKTQFLLEKLILSREDILKIAEKIIGQYANEQWLASTKITSLWHQIWRNFKSE
ncbi:hypothetical protein PPYR_00431 [Photinus pyralis]|uniref:Uncharacterized protein n=1 Tax=Photinus pyralis TaxID=7054 RepID=A0A5N4B1H7_PHOPY|nr:hypothetical protein PPYR_00431 [Photinus pyralis]